ncbi:MAG: hypothetical protein ACKPCC_02100 [Dolichospermum sp.]
MVIGDWVINFMFPHYYLFPIPTKRLSQQTLRGCWKVKLTLTHPTFTESMTWLYFSLAAATFESLRDVLSKVVTNKGNQP